MAAIESLALELARTSSVLQDTFTELNYAREELGGANTRAVELNLILQQTIAIAEAMESRMAHSESERIRAVEELELYRVFVTSFTQTETKGPDAPTSADEYTP